jgi:hypothetical protein
MTRHTYQWLVPAAALTAWLPQAALAGLLPTSVPGTMAVQGPPAGFYPLTASNEKLAEYGFPDRPDAVQSPMAYKLWRTAMQHALHRITPVLEPRPIRHVPTSYSTNWSGAVLTNIATHWQPGSFQTIWAFFTVPTVVRPSQGCNGWLYSSEWAGLDGSRTPDVVQAGIDSNSLCTHTSFTPSYDVWYEWYPAYGVYIRNISVAPRQAMLVIVKALSATQAAFYVEDETTGVYASLQTTAPAGTAYVGSSAEWITERPEVNNKITTLADYGSDSYTALAYDTGGALSLPGQPSWLVSSSLVTMLDSNGYPLSTAALPAANTVTTTVAGTAK